MYYSYDDMFNPVKGKEQALVDLYTEYYGEKYRDKIQSRLDSTEFFFLDKNPIDTIQTHYAVSIQDVLHEFEDRVGFVGASMHSIDEYKSLLVNMVVGDMDTMSVILLADIAVAMGLNFYKYDTVDDFLSDGGHYDKIVDKVDECISLWTTEYEPKVNALRDECMMYTSPFEDEHSIQDDISRYYDDKVDKVYLDYLSQHMDISRMNIMQVLNFKQTLHSAVSIGKDNLNSEYILDPKLQREFIDLFKALGFCYGSEFDAYVSDDRLLSILYNKDMIDYVYNLNKEKYVTSFMHSRQFLDAVERVKGLDTKSGTYNILASICSYLSSSRLGGFNQTHLTHDNHIKHICVCPLPAGLSDGVFLHELGHALAGEILEVHDDYFIDKSGIDTLKIDISHLDFSFEEMFKRVVVQSNADFDDSKKKHKYQLLSEVIHDYLNQDIVKLAHAKGLHFGLMSDTKDTAYSTAFDMLRDFIEANKPYIKDAMMGSDPHMLLRLLGQQRLDRLAELVEECVLLPENKRQVIHREIYGVCGYNTPMTHVVDSTHHWSKHTSRYVDMYREAYTLLSGLSKTADVDKSLD